MLSGRNRVYIRTTHTKHHTQTHAECDANANKAYTTRPAAPSVASFHKVQLHEQVTLCGDSRKRSQHLLWLLKPSSHMHNKSCQTRRDSISRIYVSTKAARGLHVCVCEVLCGMLTVIKQTRAARWFDKQTRVCSINRHRAQRWLLRLLLWRREGRPQR